MNAYMKLYVNLRDAITRGVYDYGTKIPSKRRIADQKGTSIITVEHALSLLTEEGYIEPRERSGCYVTYREDSSYAAPRPHERKAAPPVKAELRDEGERDLFPFSAFARTMRSVLSNYGRKILNPSPSRGCEELRGALSRYLARSRGMDVSPEQILIGSGAEYIYGLNVQVLGRDRLYALENPSYDKIRKVYEANGARTDLLTMGEDGIESGELSRTKASVLHVTPFNSFDSEFTLLSKPEDTLFSLAPDGLVIYMNTFSKTIAPSIRAGYLVLPRSCMALYEKKAGFYSCTVPVYDQLVLAEFIDNGDFERHINRVRRRRRKKSGNYF